MREMDEIIPEDLFAGQKAEEDFFDQGETGETETPVSEQKKPAKRVKAKEDAPKDDVPEDFFAGTPFED
jgi:hypothetical protein